MPLLMNLQKNRIENIADESVMDAVNSGNYVFRNNVQIPVISPEGDRGYIPSEKFYDATKMGFTFETKEAQKQKAVADVEKIKQEAYGDKAFLAGAAGALRGATLGLSDVALGKGLGLSEQLKEVEERNKTASTVGEVVGTIGSLATPLSIPSQLAKAGQAITTGVKGIETASKAAKVAKGIAAPLVGGAVEGGAYGLGNVLSDYAISKPELNAEHVASTIGINALLGGAIGGLTGASKELLDATKQIRQDLTSNLVDKASAGYSKLQKTFRGLSDDEAQAVKETLQNKTDLVQQAFHEPEIIQNRAMEAVNSINKSSQEAVKALSDIRRGARDEYLSGFSGVNSRGQIAKEVDSAVMGIKKEVEKSPSLYISNTFNQLDDLTKLFKQDMKTAKTKADVHKAIEGYRQNIDQIITYDKSFSNIQSANTQKLVQDFRSQLKNTLTDEKVFGKEFSQKYEGYNKNFREYFKAIDEFGKYFGTPAVNEYGRKIKHVFEIDDAKVANYFRNPDAFNKTKAGSALTNMDKAVNKLGTDLALPEVQNSLQIARDSIQNLKETRGLAILFNRLESQTGKSLTGIALGTATGALTNPILGGAIALTGHLVYNPKQVLNVVTMLKEYGTKGQGKLVSAANSISKMSTKPLELGKRLTLSQAVKYLVPDSKPKDFNETKQAFNNIAIDKNYVDNLMQKSMPELESVSPEHYASIHNTLQNAIGFINSKMPQNMDYLNKTQRLTKTQEIQLDNYVDATFRPQKLYEEIKSGNVHKETVEAVRTVWPELYKELQDQVFNSITDAKNIPMSRRNQLGTIFGIPTSNSLKNINELQFNYSPQMEAKQQAAKFEADFGNVQSDTQRLQTS